MLRSKINRSKTDTTDRDDIDEITGQGPDFWQSITTDRDDIDEITGQRIFPNIQNEKLPCYIMFGFEAQSIQTMTQKQNQSQIGPLKYRTFMVEMADENEFLYAGQDLKWVMERVGKMNKSRSKQNRNPNIPLPKDSKSGVYRDTISMYLDPKSGKQKVENLIKKQEEMIQKKLLIQQSTETSGVNQDSDSESFTKSLSSSDY